MMGPLNYTRGISQSLWVIGDRNGMILFDWDEESGIAVQRMV